MPLQATDGNRRRAIKGFMCALLRGEAARWRSGAGEQDVTAFLESATRHGVQALLAREMRKAGGSGWPEAIQRELADAARRAAVTEQVLQLELRRVLSVLAGEGVRAVVMKGAELAYTHYPHPCLRPRFDTDLLVRRVDLAAVERVMAGLGYTAAVDVRGELLTHQVHYGKQGPHGVWHTYDVHWKPSNPHVFADLLSFEELAEQAVAVPPLGERARGLGPVHALLLACIHRVAHHNDAGRLIWLYDIHLLTNSMDAAGFQAFTRLAADKRIGALSARGLTLARQSFGSRVPPDVVPALSTRLRAGRREPSAVFLGGNLRQIDILIADLKALPGWRRRLQLLQEHAFPRPAYMLATYRVLSRALLPALYAHRLVGGAWRWFRRPEQQIQF